MGMDCPYSSSEQWKPLAQAILAEDRNLTLNPIPGNFYRYRHANPFKSGKRVLMVPLGAAPGYKISQGRLFPYTELLTVSGKEERNGKEAHRLEECNFLYFRSGDCCSY